MIFKPNSITRHHFHLCVQCVYSLLTSDAMSLPRAVCLRQRQQNVVQYTAFMLGFRAFALLVLAMLLVLGLADAGSGTVSVRSSFWFTHVFCMYFLSLLIFWSICIFCITDSKVIFCRFACVFIMNTESISFHHWVRVFSYFPFMFLTIHCAAVFSHIFSHVFNIEMFCWGSSSDDVSIILSETFWHCLNHWCQRQGSIIVNHQWCSLLFQPLMSAPGFQKIRFVI